MRHHKNHQHQVDHHHHHHHQVWHAGRVGARCTFEPQSRFHQSLGSDPPSFSGSNIFNLSICTSLNIFQYLHTAASDMNVKRIISWTAVEDFWSFDLLLGRTSPILLTLSHNPPALILRIGNNQCDGKFISDSLQREIITSFPRMNKQTRKETSFQIQFYSPWSFLLGPGGKHLPLWSSFTFPPSSQNCSLHRQQYLCHFVITRPKPAYGRQGLDWIVRPGYSFVVFSTNRGI